MYYTILNLWILSFHENTHKFFTDIRLKLVEKIVTVVNRIAKEKILRVALGIFRVFLYAQSYIF